ncbi:MAG: YfbK domain-containing protein, partial [Thermodesulfobacteriota bacterium]
YEIAKTERPKANLVFLLDVSGSMSSPDKLPLLINSMKMLVNELKPTDTVAIAVYAGAAGTVLEPTAIKEKHKIIAALERLRAGGSTAGGAGIKLAYSLALSSFDKNAVNRVILATDGDFNVGISNPEELKGFIERKRDTGVFLSVLGFGQGNYNDELMQKLAQNGNGNAAYIDTLSEARKVLVEEAGATLFTIAKDVKVQIEFNPERVKEYRLIGYESRMLKREDFNNDKVDAGDVGSGHSVTAIYEITPVDSESALVDPLRYKKEAANKTISANSEYAFLKIRYKLPKETKSRLITEPVDYRYDRESIKEAQTDVRFAASVAAFGQILKGGTYTGSFGYDDVSTLATTARGSDRFGYRSEFLSLIGLAKSADAMGNR